MIVTDKCQLEGDNRYDLDTKQPWNVSVICQYQMAGVGLTCLLLSRWSVEADQVVSEG